MTVSDTMAISKNRIEIKLDIPQRAKQVESNPCLNINVLFINHTDTAVSFFEDWNSWGYYNLSFEIRSGNTSFLITKKERDWPKNFPSFKTLFPGDSLELRFDNFSSECSFYQYSGLINAVLNPGSSIKAIYQLPEGALLDAKRNGFLDSTEMVKYKYKKVKNLSSYTTDFKDWVVIDSLEKPVLIFQTFPLSKLESAEYRLY